MIPRTDTPLHDHSWQWRLQNAIRDSNELAKEIELDLQDCATDFPILVPRPYLDRIKKGDRQDPLLQQILPTSRENIFVEGFTPDPLRELDQAQGPVIQKYRSRILIVTTGTCAINCRYCFRRHFPYGDFHLSRGDWNRVTAYINEDPTIREVILSGGDPLMMPDRQLAALAETLETQTQLSHLRIHTRLPVVIPQRVNADLLTWIARSRLKVIVVIHANHSQELDDNVTQAIDRLKSADVMVLNQSVLLKSINDDFKSLCDLSWRLSEMGVLPYYLHLLDKVSGAAHFDVSASRGAALIREMRDHLPGYLVPKLVTEIPGAPAKQEIVK